MGSSTCNCYEFTAEVTGLASYTDCDNITQFIPITFGNIYNFCTNDISSFNGATRLPTSTTLLGGCVDGICLALTTTTTTYFPLTTTTTTFNPVQPTPVEPTNECDVITIFPMGVECQSIDPSFTNTFDGVVSLVITGGTPPYEILWNNGSVGTTISNLGVGEYTATVTDTYGDFLLTSTCVLTAETPSTTTTTTSTTPVPSYSDLCMIVEIYNSKLPQVIQVDFIYDGILNGKPSWLSSSGDELIYWNTGTTQEWLVSGTTSYTIYNPNPVSPPLVGWNVLGINAEVNVVEGSCSSIPRLFISINKNEPTCTNNGSIVVQATGGIPPYEYSKNTGISYQTNPIFNNLSAGSYVIKVKDSVNNTQSQIVTLTSTVTSTIYTITLNRTSNTFNVTISPTLPAGVTINFDLVYQSTFTVAPNPTSATYNGGLNVLLNGGPILPSTPVITNSTSFNVCNGGSFYTTNTTKTWGNITMSTSSTLNGTIDNLVTPILPLPTCYSAARNYTITLNNVSINGCECCDYLVQQTAEVGVNIGRL